MPQTSYPIDNAIALAGQIQDRKQMEGRLQASEALEAGVLVEVNAGQLRHPQTSHAAGDYGYLMGVTAYRAAIEPNGFPTIVGGEWQTGDYPPVIKKGQIWCKFHGTTAPSLGGAVNFWHPSDNSASNAQYRGMLTDAATSTAVGSEISALPAASFSVVKNATDIDGNTIVLLDCNVT